MYCIPTVRLRQRSPAGSICMSRRVWGRSQRHQRSAARSGDQTLRNWVDESLVPGFGELDHAVDLERHANARLRDRASQRAFRTMSGSALLLLPTSDHGITSAWFRLHGSSTPVMMAQSKT